MLEISRLVKSSRRSNHGSLVRLLLSGTEQVDLGPQGLFCCRPVLF